MRVPKKTSNPLFNQPLFQKRGRPITVDAQPRFDRPDSQLCSAEQIFSDSARPWMELLAGGVALDRKLWEYAFVLQAVSVYANCSEGSRGLAFGVGREILPAYFASRGAHILATDLVEQEHDWQSRGVEELWRADLLAEADFLERVSFANCDMNAIPGEWTDFDFCWSVGSLEHIGGHQNGLDFIRSSLEALRPGGVAVHTTEFSVDAPDDRFDHPELSIYCREDMEALALTLISEGHHIVLNFNRGSSPKDHYIDLPGEDGSFHFGKSILACIGSRVITSIGLIIQKGAD